MATKKKPKRGAAARTDAKPVRRDLDVYNEATGFMVFSRGLAGRDLTEAEQGGAKWKAAARDGVFIPVGLVQDDPILVRVVVDDALDAQEADEWVDKLDAALSVKDGKLCVMGGGAEFLAEPGGDHALYLREVAIPPGDYRATLYTYLPGVNGRYCLETATKVEAEKLDAWFARTRPNAKEPDWIKKSASARKTEYVHFLLHLERLADGEKPRASAKLDDEGWFPQSVAPRKPERCPLGLLAKEPILRDEPPAALREKPKAAVGVEVLSRVADRALAPIDGGPVTVPPKRLERLYQLALFAAREAAPQPEIVLEAPANIFYEPQSGLSFEVVREGDCVWRIRFAPCDRPTMLAQVTNAAGSLGIIPKKSVLELVTAPSGGAGGLMRWRGEIEDWMTWKVSESHPKTDKPSVEAALALQREGALGIAITARSDEEAARILERARAEIDPKAFARLARDGAKIVLTKPSGPLLQTVAASAFRVMFGGIWA